MPKPSKRTSPFSDNDNDTDTPHHPLPPDTITPLKDLSELIQDTAPSFSHLELTKEECELVTNPLTARVLKSDLEVLNSVLEMTITCFKGCTTIYDIVAISNAAVTLLKNRRELLANLPPPSAARPQLAPAPQGSSAAANGTNPHPTVAQLNPTEPPRPISTYLK